MAYKIDLKTELLLCGKSSVNLVLVLDFPVNSASRGPHHNPLVGSSSLPPATRSKDFPLGWPDEHTHP